MAKNSVSEDDEFEIYIRDSKEVDPELWEKSMDQKLMMDPLSLKNYDPGKQIIDEFKNKVGLFINDEKDISAITLDTDANPYDGISYGFIESFVRVSSKSPFFSGTLVLVYDPMKLGKVDRDTLHLFRWNEDKQFFELIEPSAVGKEGNYVWGRITLPGIYGLIGLNSDPLINNFLKITSDDKEKLKIMNLEEQKGFLYDTCTKILGSDHELCRSLKEEMG
jgi:hypothetical protein